MSKSSGGKGGRGGQGGKSGGGQRGKGSQGGGWPSKTGERSGPDRDNAPPGGGSKS